MFSNVSTAPPAGRVLYISLADRHNDVSINICILFSVKQVPVCNYSRKSSGSVKMPAPLITSTQYSKVNAVTEKNSLLVENHELLDIFKRYRSLAWMILSWIGGIALAVGHHFFYTRFDNKQVAETSISQEWIIRIGTGMAFAVQTLFVVSASIACTQQQWLITRSKPFNVRQIDTVFSILGNALAFLQSRVWLRYPGLSLLAAIAW